MPDEHSNAEDKLRKLGQRVREGWAKKHPTSEKQIQLIRGVIREEWEKEQKAKKGPGRSRKPDKEPPGPER